MGESATVEERLKTQADRLRASGGLGRSDSLVRLFDFLVTQTLAGRAPKEIEIAQEVFDKHGSFDVMLDASVRVYIHRLRRKIDDFYAASVVGNDRLTIPKGEYRLVLATDRIEDHEGDQAQDAMPSAGLSGGRSIRRIITLSIGSILAANIAIWLIVMQPWSKNPVAQAMASRFWKPLADNGRPTVVVTGDYYIFGDTSGTIEVTRLVRQFSINSKGDLDQYLMAHPEDIGRYTDLGLHYLPTSIAPALRDILPLVSGTAGAGGQEFLIPVSQMTPDMLKKANIVYLGYLSGLGLLRGPVFDASGFQIGSSYDELIDRRTGKHYISDQGDIAGRKQPQRDFAYIASLPGPSGTRVLIVSGTRDAAVLQAAEIASDRRQLDRMSAATGNAPAYEALYQVQTLDDLNLGSTLVVARALQVDKLWNLDSMRQRGFPDQGAPAR